MACVKKRRGKWVLDFRDQTGRRRWESYETRKLADAALAKRIGDVKGGVYKAPAELPTFAAVAEQWLDGRRDRAQSTVTYYRKLLDCHLLPTFGPRRIDTITPADVERFRNEKRDGGALNPTTINALLRQLTSILNHAVKHGYIARNPAAHTLVERVRRARVADQVAEIVDPSMVLTAEQAHAVIAAAEPGLHRTFITTAILTGCRSGELLALTWAHVDLETRKLRIGRSLSWDRTDGASKPVFGPAKTESSHRTLDLVPELARALAEWKVRSPYKRDADLVFTNQAGGPLHLAHLRRGFRSALAACDAPMINLHGLRHSFASLMISMNKPVTQVAKLLGHKDPSITLTVYSHWFADAEEKNREALGELAAAVLGASGSKTVAPASA
jgi:integrase